MSGGIILYLMIGFAFVYQFGMMYRVLHVRGQLVWSLGQALGLKSVKNRVMRFLPSFELVGTQNGIKTHVHVGFVSRENALKDPEPQGYQFTLTMTLPSSLRYKLSLGRENLLKRVGILSPSGDITTGDSSFDKEVKVAAEYVPGALSLLDAPTRKLLLRLVNLTETFQIRGSELTATLSTDTSTLRLEQAYGVALELLERLQGQGTLNDRLVQLAVTDPVGEVRRRTLELVLSREPVTDALKESLLLPLSRDPLLPIQAMAAVAAGGEALASLCSLVAGMPRPWPEPILQRLASSSEPLVLPVLRAGLAQVSDPAPLVRGLVRLRDTASLGTLAQAWRVSSGRASGAIYLEGVRQLGSDDLEPLWLEVLDDTGRAGSEIRVALQALAEKGSVRAVQPLKRWVGLFGGETSKLAETAIRQIQARVSGGDSGQLMLTDTPDTAGRLMLTGGEAGGLTLTAETAGGLALAPEGGQKLLP